ncbi:MAG: bifunctional serine/threonine-protein kinase/formylglycine-generating enzyme family protein [Planctomycetaceae bacterium]
MRLVRPHFTDTTSVRHPRLSDNAAEEDSDSFRIDKTEPGTRLSSGEFSHYELLGIIGEGQFGTVWRAKDQRLDRIVALKLPRLENWNEHARTMFLREARAAATLEHPHIVRVHAIEQIDGDQLGIVSQFIVGRTLFEILQDRRLTFSESTQLLATVAEAVHFGHEAGVIHRDLKPSNILVDLAGQPHVSDFGLAKWGGDKTSLTEPGLIVGTPAYMSPEQAGGNSHDVDRRSDVYSLGVLFYEMLVGKPPFDGNSTLLLHQVQRQAPKPPRSHNEAIPRDLETICLKCLAKAPDERYGTARELADDLRRFLAGEPITARFVSVAERGVSWARRNRTLATSFAMAAISTVAALGLSFAFLAWSRPKTLAVSVVTEPPGATVVIYPLDELTGEPIVAQAARPSMKSPLAVNLLPGDYLVVAALSDDRFHEVYRHVPRNPNATPDYYPHRAWETHANGVISWLPINIPLADVRGMTLLEDAEAGRSVRPFLLDQQEIRVSDFLHEYRDQLPFSLRGRTELSRTPDFPITGLFFDEAVLYAELVGKRLPTAREYEFAATNGWTTSFPWGDNAPPAEVWKLAEVGLKQFDRTRSDPPILGLFSNASEFVLAQHSPSASVPFGSVVIAEDHPTNVAVRGGPVLADDHGQGEPRSEISIARKSIHRQVGFRCAKSKSPRL